MGLPQFREDWNNVYLITIQNEPSSVTKLRQFHASNIIILAPHSIGTSWVTELLQLAWDTPIPVGNLFSVVIGDSMQKFVISHALCVARHHITPEMWWYGRPVSSCYVIYKSHISRRSVGVVKTAYQWEGASGEGHCAEVMSSWFQRVYILSAAVWYLLSVFQKYHLSDLAPKTVAMAMLGSVVAVQHICGN